MEIKENEELNVITDNSKVNINLLKQIEILKAENEELREVIKGHERVLQSQNMDLTVERKRVTKLKEALLTERERTEKSISRNLELIKENTKLKEALKDIRSQLFDSKNCETILTKSIDALLKD